MTDHIVKLAAVVSGVGIVGIAFVITASSIMRFGFGGGIPRIDEGTAVINVFIVYLGLGYALVTRAHVKVDFLVKRLPEHTGNALSLGTSFISLIIVCVLAWLVGKAILWNMAHNILLYSLFRLPVFLFQLPMGIGLLIFILALWQKVAKETSIFLGKDQPEEKAEDKSV